MTGGRGYARPFGPRYDNLDVMNDRGAEDTLGPSGLGMTERQGLGMTICVMARCPIRSGMTLRLHERQGDGSGVGGALEGVGLSE